MAIDTITPIASSVIEPGDSAAFTVDDTYTTLTIQVQAAGGLESAYSGGVAQPGYSVAVTSAGGRDTFTVGRDAGWNKSPQSIIVTEDETGSSAQTTFSYVLSTTALYPEGAQPFNAVSEGTLVVSEDEVSIRQDVGQIDFDDATFDITDLGGGKVKVTGIAGGTGNVVGPASSGDGNLAVFDGTTGKLLKDGGVGSASTLDAVITSGTPDNDIIIPAADTLVFRDGAVVAVTPLTVEKTGSSTTVPTMELLGPTTSVGLRITNVGDGSAVHYGQTGIISVPGTTGQPLGFGGGTTTSTSPGDVTINGTSTNTTSKSGKLRLKGGDGVNGVSGDGGDVVIDGGFPLITGLNGSIIIGDQDPTEIEFGKGFTIRETAGPPVTSVAAKAQLWVRDDAEQSLIFTDDAGTDIQLGRTYITLCSAGRFTGAVASTWYSHPAQTVWDAGSAATAAGTGTDPAMTHNFTGLYVPADGTIITVNFQYTLNVASGDGKIVLYKARPTTGTTTLVNTAVATADYGGADPDAVNVSHLLSRTGLTESVLTHDRLRVWHKQGATVQQTISTISVSILIALD